jgi:hypothetical protein
MSTEPLTPSLQYGACHAGALMYKMQSTARGPPLTARPSISHYEVRGHGHAPATPLLPTAPPLPPPSLPPIR